MIFSEDKAIKLGGVTLPGLIKKIEIKSSAAIDEVDVEGSAVKPKQPVGYEDAKVTIDLIVDATSSETALEKITRINTLFKTTGQTVPQPLLLVCSEAAAIGLTTVLFKDFDFNKTNKSDQYAAKLTLWEYIPVVITATTSSSDTADETEPELDDDYRSYLDTDRGAAPKISDKTASSPVFWEEME